MTEFDEQVFWKDQTSSLHRSGDPHFYTRKAVEHASLMSQLEKERPCLDLGCGAGELLVHLKNHMNVVTGLDYSESMLDKAKKRLADSEIRLINTEFFEYLKIATESTWMTTGALNQYLNLKSTTHFLTLFKNNDDAKSLFLFDCVDPIRYAAMQFGLSYIPSVTSNSRGLRDVVRYIRWRLRLIQFGLKLSLGLIGRSNVKIGRVGMGYGYSPQVWHGLLSELNLRGEVVSSLFYEYRFHIIIRKK